MNLEITGPVQIDVETLYLEDQSLPTSDKYAFAYTITITNTGQEDVRLLNRHWIITDGNDKSREISGEGVVGEQPLIAAGDKYQYTSGAVIETEFGIMQGCYEMISASGRQFLAPIDPFTLASPRAVH